MATTPEAKGTRGERGFPRATQRFFSMGGDRKARMRRVIVFVALIEATKDERDRMKGERLDQGSVLVQDGSAGSGPRDVLNRSPRLL